MNNYYNNFPCSQPKNGLYRSGSSSHKSEKKKFNFKCMKDNTISSLNDVEFFLNKLQCSLRYIKLYKLLK